MPINLKRPALAHQPSFPTVGEHKTRFSTLAAKIGEIVNKYPFLILNKDLTFRKFNYDFVLDCSSVIFHDKMCISCIYFH